MPGIYTPPNPFGSKNINNCNKYSRLKRLFHVIVGVYAAAAVILRIHSRQDTLEKTAGPTLMVYLHYYPRGIIPGPGSILLVMYKLRY